MDEGEPAGDRSRGGGAGERGSGARREACRFDDSATSTKCTATGSLELLLATIDLRVGRGERTSLDGGVRDRSVAPGTHDRIVLERSDGLCGRRLVAGVARTAGTACEVARADAELVGAPRAVRRRWLSRNVMCTDAER